MENNLIVTDFIRSYYYHKNMQVLDVTNNDGTVYQYFQVPEKTVDEFVSSEQPGIYYKNFIRKKFKRLFKRFEY